MTRKIIEIETEQDKIKWILFDVPFYDYSIMIFNSGAIKYLQENTVINNGKNDIRKEISKKQFPKQLLKYIETV